MYLWRAVDDEGEVLDMLVQRRRDSRSALRLMRKLLKKQGCAPKIVVIDKHLRFTPSYRDIEESLAERRLDISYETGREAMAAVQSGAMPASYPIRRWLMTRFP